MNVYQWSELLLLVGGQLGELVLSGCKLFGIVNEIANSEFIFASLKQKKIIQMKEGDGTACVVFNQLWARLFLNHK